MILVLSLSLIHRQDPFETDYNVARCVTKEGLYQVIVGLYLAPSY